MSLGTLQGTFCRILVDDVMPDHGTGTQTCLRLGTLKPKAPGVATPMPADPSASLPTDPGTLSPIDLGTQSST